MAKKHSGQCGGVAEIAATNVRESEANESSSRGERALDQHHYTPGAHEAESRLRALLSNHSLGILEVTPAGCVTMANRTLGDWLGVESCALVGRDLVALMPDEDHAMLMRQLAKLADERIDSTAIAHRFRNRAGDDLWVRSTWSARRSNGGAISHLIAIVENIADERRDELVRSILEESIRGLESRRRFVDRLIDGLPVITWQALPNGACQYLSPQWRAFTGMVDATGVQWLAALHPDDRAAVSTLWIDDAPPEGEHRRMCWRIRRVDGTYHRFDIVARPLCSNDGDVLSWTGVCIPAAAQEAVVTAASRSGACQRVALPLRGQAIRTTTDPPHDHRSA